MFEYEDIKQLARETGCKVTDLTVLAPGNDPFYAGVPFRRQRAEWFAELWERFGFQHGVHLRRIHYVLVSQPEPIRWPNGKPYENTENDWTVLDTASLAARYLGLIPPDVLVDRRNPAPLILAGSSFSPEPAIFLTGAAIDIDLPSEFPVSGLALTGFGRGQDYLVEVWAEKSTMNDILGPLAHRFGFNLVTGVGEMSETATRLAVERAVEANKPMRILYVSDFDPAGRSMPVAVARKIEHKLYAAGIDADITLQPIVLTPEQCAEYELPRTPIKGTEKRAARFEYRFGSGATELDALEALHPGKLAEIIESEVTRYIDPTLTSRVGAAESGIYRTIRSIEGGLRERYAEEIEGMSDRYDSLLAEAAEIESDASDLWDRMDDNLREEKPEINVAMIPSPRDPDPVEEPLYDAGRDYFEQLDHYHAWQRR